MNARRRSGGVGGARSRRLSRLALACLAFAFAYLIQPAGVNELAHYDLTRALSHGSPTIDEELRYPGLETLDISSLEGHAYAAKAPGLAFVSLPAYGVASAAGVDTTGDPKRAVWALHLWGVVLPALSLLVLVRRVADGVEPGFGTAAAVLLGGATLILPFSTVLFSHVLSALLGFTAFVLLQAGDRASLAYAAGVAVGLGVTVEYPLGLVAIALGVYVLLRSDPIGHAAAYAGGVATGVLPTFLFGAWAFGDPFHLSYEGWHVPGAEPLPGVFGITSPQLETLLKIVFFPGGVAPILLPALVGGVLLWRRGSRALVAAALLVTTLFLVYESANTTPFGGASPGPRYLIPALPFLAVLVAPALRTIPGATLGLAVPAGVFFAAVTVTAPLAALDGEVVQRLRTGGYASSVAGLVGIDGGAADAAFVLALVASAAIALVVTPWQGSWRREGTAGLVAAVGWIVLAGRTPGWLDDGVAGQLAVIAVAVAGTAAVAMVYRTPARLQLLRARRTQPRANES